MKRTVNQKRGKLVGKKQDEWLKQADYDMDTAEFMFSGERYFYAVFMTPHSSMITDMSYIILDYI